MFIPFAAEWRSAAGFSGARAAEVKRYGGDV
jgi:hypothetical protein